MDDPSTDAAPAEEPATDDAEAAGAPGDASEPEAAPPEDPPGEAPGGDAPAEEAGPPAGDAEAGSDPAPAAEGETGAAGEGDAEAAAPDGGDGGGDEATAAAEGDAPGADGDAAGVEPAAEPEPDPEPEVDDYMEDDMDNLFGAGAATEIEGFDDDFMDDAAMDDELLSEEEEEEEEEAKEDIEHLIQEIADERERLKATNLALQRKIAVVVQGRKPVGDASRSTSSKLQAENQEARYHSALHQWQALVHEKERMEVHYETTTSDVQAHLGERVKRANDIRNAFNSFKYEVARSAENSRTGKPIPERIIGEKMKQEEKKELELERARLKNIHLRYQLRRLEQELKAKEELSEGLHLIDFEQLKIENQSLNEKIEERNEELLKLRKKTTTTVQVLTHLKEKLQFVQKENESLSAGMTSLEYGLTSKREQLHRMKMERDALRAENGKMKGQSATVTNPMLLDDMDAHQERASELKRQLSSLKASVANLARKTQGLRGSVTPSRSPSKNVVQQQPPTLLV